jgi:hypothetical protein
MVATSPVTTGAAIDVPCIIRERGFTTTAAFAAIHAGVPTCEDSADCSCAPGAVTSTPRTSWVTPYDVVGAMELARSGPGLEKLVISRTLGSWLATRPLPFTSVHVNRELQAATLTVAAESAGVPTR